MARIFSKHLTWCAAALLFVGLHSAQAADALHGKTLYTNTPGGISCANSSCHGTNVASNRNRLLNGANNPSVIQNAINRGTGGMGIYKTTLSTADVADIAAYIGNPGVTAGSATASLSSSSLSFAATAVGIGSATQTVTLSNTGSAALSITSLTAGGSNSGDFLRSGSCAAGGSVAVGGNCTLSYSFKPTASGARSASLSIVSNAGNGTLTLNLSGTGASSSASLSPSSLSFGSLAVGTLSSALSATVSNTGSSALTITAISISVGDFSISGGSCSVGASLGTGASCTVLSKLQPTTAGARSATLSVTTSAGGSLSVALGGIGTVVSVPVAQLSPGSLSFSAQQGMTSLAQSVTLSNTGNGNLNLSAISFTGTAAADYATGTGTTCTTSSSLAASGSCVITIVFTPSATGSHSASLSISHNDSTHSPSLVTLNGSGTVLARGQLSLDHVALNFAAQPQGSSSVQTVTVSNTGSAAVSFSAISLSGSQSGDYGLLGGTGSCTSTTVLAQGGSCALSIRFTPSVSSGTRNASVQLSSDASNNTVTLSLSGTAAASAPLASFDPTSVDFGSSGIGVAATAKNVTLRNSGTASLSISSLSVTPADYTLSHNCGISLAAGSSCSLQIGFIPSRSGSISGSLSLVSNATGSPLSIVLSGAGTGGSASLSWMPSSGLSFAPTVVGAQSAPVTAQLTNTGVGTAALQGFGIAGAQASDFSIDPTTTCPSSGPLAAGASCTVVLVFMPSAADQRSANLTVSSNGSAGPPLALSGTGSATGGPLLSLAPAVMTLTGMVNQALDPQALVLSNDGAGVLTISSYVVPSTLTLASGGASGGTCPTPPFQLQPGYSCSVMVTPASSGTVDGQIQIVSDSSSTPATVQVSGTANVNAGAGAFLIGRFASPREQIASLLLLITLLSLRLRLRHWQLRRTRPSHLR